MIIWKRFCFSYTAITLKKGIIKGKLEVTASSSELAAKRVTPLMFSDLSDAWPVLVWARVEEVD